MAIKICGKWEKETNAVTQQYHTENQVKTAESAVLFSSRERWKVSNTNCARKQK